MAQRPVWEGHLRLSLVACPVSLFTATTSANDVRFHLINPATNNRVRQQLVDPDTGEIDRKSVVRGFEVEKDQYVLLTDEEIRSVRLESTRTLDIERFVDVSAIDHIWWNDPYFLVPNGNAGIDAFLVIRTAMEDAGKIALARLVMGARERVVAIEPRGAGMLVTTLRGHDEVRDGADVFDAIPPRKPDAKMIAIAEQIIAQQAGPFDPSSFNDRYEEALRDLIRQKQDGGGGGVSAPPPRASNVIDLMEALRRSLEGKGPPAVAAKATAAKPTAAKATAAKPVANRKPKSEPPKRRRAASS